MNKKITYGLMLIIVAGYTAYVVATDGYLSIVHAAMASPGALQITLDLVAALLLVVAWIYQDAKAQQRNPWPWIAATCVVGTSAPLAYLFVRELKNT